MKNQYFGDSRDLFKYDLVFQIIKAGLVQHFTFIPMLTKNEADEKHGEDNKRDGKPGSGNKALVNYLDKCRKEGKRNIKQINRFFQDHDINLTIYRRYDYFDRAQRKTEKRCQAAGTFW